MAIESELLVIGGGLAGLTSAIAAAQEFERRESSERASGAPASSQGADVRLVSYKQSTLQQASGLVDVLGYTPNGDGPLADPFEAIPALPPSHPYRTVGVDGVREAMALFDDVTDYCGGHTDRNALVPTHGGTVKPTARYPPSVAAGLASDERETLLVGFESLVDFDAPQAAAHLEAAGVPFSVNGVTIPFPGDLRPDAKLTRYAKLLEANEAVDAEGRLVGARDALAAAVTSHLETAERVGFPAILGDDSPTRVRTALGEAIDVDVFEVPMGPPSLPGLRLEDTLFDVLHAAGAGIETGNPVVDFAADGDRIEEVIVERNGARVPYGADQYVLATGGLVGKGVDSDRENVYEPIFDCHVPHAADRYEWFDGDVFGDHPFAQFGVRTDDELRPLTADGTVEFENLRAAGAVLGGYDFAAEKSGSGVSIATGYGVGRAAARSIREVSA